MVNHNNHQRKFSVMTHNHCVKYRNFTEFPDVEMLWKGTVSAVFPVVCLSTKFQHQEIR